ncbi:hypothetical protein [Desulfofustis limnaeus]|uniref:Uncharacterized protein n=1 Tax=Desulfofustis limnaeus TaxID=2740163 RepID=A0ABM7WC59_9BACT|nr:hypothetical protein [Desulfofustis limnaeus]BDD88585.1 hypothetical protein DPPLL_29500 [Desulfofustis limnaeus]
MAPARMVQFMKQHVASCSVCKEDPDVGEEVDKITDIILPESKIPKAVRQKQDFDDDDAYDEEEEEEETDEETDEESEEDSDEEFEDEDFSEDEDAITEEDENDDF